MRIADISPFKGNSMRVSLSDGSQIFIHKDVIADSGISAGTEISENAAEELVYMNDLRRAKERALYLVEARDYSYSMLFDKLEENYPEEICFEVCGWLKKIGVIDDRRYAEKLCRRLFEVKKYGSYRVKQELRMKGISSEIINEVIAEYCYEDEDSFERLERLVEQKYERYLVDRKGVAKVKNALARRGYSYGEIKEVLDLYDLDFDE